MEGDQTILLAEDTEDDVLLTQIAFRKARLANHLAVGRDGDEAIAYLEGYGTRWPGNALATSAAILFSVLCSCSFTPFAGVFFP
jgi:hypothetical protein